MRTARFFLFCFFTPSLVCAHQLTVRPLRIECRVDSQKVRVTITAHQSYWMEDILGVRNLPASHWPQNLSSKSKDYIDSHFSLTVNGQPLPGNLEDCRYIENFWEVRTGGSVVFWLTYPLPDRFRGGVPAGSLLSGRSRFYSEALGDLNEIRDRVEHDREALWFRTDVVIQGRMFRHLVLTPAFSYFSVPWDESLETLSETIHEYGQDGWRWVFIQFSLALFIVATCLRLVPPRVSGHALFIFLFVLTLSFLMPPLIPHAEKLLWVFVMAMAAAAWFRFPSSAWLVLLGMGVFVAGGVMAKAPVLREAPPEYFSTARWSFLGGVIFSGVVLAVVSSLALILTRERFRRIYATVWERIFFSHVRFLSQALVAVSAFFLFHGLVRHP